jgi:hypothetical protein
MDIGRPPPTSHVENRRSPEVVKRADPHDIRIGGLEDGEPT